MPIADDVTAAPVALHARRLITHQGFPTAILHTFRILPSACAGSVWVRASWPAWLPVHRW
jgi:hypothetical protein